MRTHEIAQTLPAMSDREYEELTASIEANGLMQPITTYQGAILDGRHREQACRELGIEPRYEEYTGKDPVGYVIAANVTRRHLDESQRAMIAARLATLTHGGNRKSEEIKSPTGDLKTQASAAETLNVGKRSVERARRVLDQGVTQLQNMVDQGEIKVAEAAEIAGLHKEAQKEILATGGKQERREKIRQMRGSDSGVSAHENPKVHRWRTGLRRLQLFVTMREKEGGPGSILDGISGDHRQRWASQLRGIASVFQGWASALEAQDLKTVSLTGDSHAAVETDGTSPGDQTVAPGSQQDGTAPIEASEDVGQADPPAYPEEIPKYFRGLKRKRNRGSQSKAGAAPEEQGRESLTAECGEK
jgi:ParB-like chromosome segregation protein Spo0J